MRLPLVSWTPVSHRSVQLPRWLVPQARKDPGPGYKPAGARNGCHGEQQTDTPGKEEAEKESCMGISF